MPCPHYRSGGRRVISHLSQAVRRHNHNHFVDRGGGDLGGCRRRSAVPTKVKCVPVRLRPSCDAHRGRGLSTEVARRRPHGTVSELSRSALRHPNRRRHRISGGIAELHVRGRLRCAGTATRSSGMPAPDDVSRPLGINAASARPVVGARTARARTAPAASVDT